MKIQYMAMFCISLMYMSCNSYEKFPVQLIQQRTDNQSITNIHNDNFICFIKNDIIVCVTTYVNSETYADYIDKEARFIGTKNQSYQLLDLHNDILSIRENRKSGASLVRIIDLKNGNDLLRKGYYSIAKYQQDNERNTVLKHIGDRINREQQKMLKIPIDNLETYAENLYKTGFAIEFYEKYKFNYEKHSIEKANEVVLVIYQRNTMLWPSRLALRAFGAKAV